MFCFQIYKWELEIKRTGSRKHKCSLQTANALQDMRWGIRMKCGSAISESCWEVKIQPTWACANTMMIMMYTAAHPLLLPDCQRVPSAYRRPSKQRYVRKESALFSALPHGKLSRERLNSSYHIRVARSLHLQGTVLSDGSHILKADKPDFCTLGTGGKYF